MSKLAAEDGTHSGCTAVTAFLRLEDENGNAVELDEDPDHAVGSAVMRGGAGHGHGHGQGGETTYDGGKENISAQESRDAAQSPATPSEMDEDRKRKFGDGSHRERLKSLFGGSSSSSNNNKDTPDQKRTTSVTADSNEQAQQAEGVKRPARAKNMARRTLYTANVGDARAVLR